ncbi:MAG: C4-dicarboxylate ABC transporter, partial [Chromatiales bacterium]
MEMVSVLLFVSVIVVLLAGYPVAFSLAGTALIFAFAGAALGVFDPSYLTAMPNRGFGIMTNETLLDVPLFVFMGIMLE